LIKALLKKTADHGLVVFQRHRLASLPASNVLSACPTATILEHKAMNCG
jgi:hypothetical protein